LPARIASFDLTPRRATMRPAAAATSESSAGIRPPSTRSAVMRTVASLMELMTI